MQQHNEIIYTKITYDQIDNNFTNITSSDKTSQFNKTKLKNKQKLEELHILNCCSTC